MRNPDRANPWVLPEQGLQLVVNDLEHVRLALLGLCR
jgi:hypothetical protein